MRNDFYETLGLTRGSNPTQEEIKSAYKKLIVQWHPDKNNNSEESLKKTQEINEAYDVLGDPDKRQQYDNEFNAPSFNDIMFPNDDFFNFFGGNFFRQHQVVKNSDKQLKIDVDIHKILNSKEKLHLKYKQKELCPTCLGKGCSKWENCDACNGSGMIQRSYIHNNSTFFERTPCGFCKGKGEKVIEVCGTCSGFGLISKENTIVVDNNITSYLRPIVYQGMGDKDNNLNMPPGNLIVFVNIKVPVGEVEPSTYNVIITHDIDVLNMIAQGEINISFMNKNYSINLEHNKTIYTIKGGGLKIDNNKYSDLILRLNPVIKPIDSELQDQIKQKINKENIII